MERNASRRAAPRAIGAFIAGSVGIVVLLNSTVAVWAEDTVFDPATAGVIVDEVLARPVVTASLAEWVAVEVFTHFSWHRSSRCSDAICPMTSAGLWSTAATQWSRRGARCRRRNVWSLSPIGRRSSCS